MGQEENGTLGTMAKIKLQGFTQLQQRWQKEASGWVTICTTRMLLGSAVSLHPSMQKTKGTTGNTHLGNGKNQPEGLVLETLG